MEQLKLAEQILAGALERGADMAECFVSNTAFTELDSEAGEIHLARHVATDQISLKVIVGKKKGSVSLNQKEDASIAEAIEKALKSAGDATPDEAEGIADEKENGRFAFGEPEPDLDRLYTLLDTLIADTKQAFPLVCFESAGIHHTSTRSVYANSNGVRHEVQNGRNTVSCMFSASKDGTSSSFNYFGMLIPDDCTDLLALDGVRRLLGDAEKQIETVSIGDGAIEDVLLSPECFDNMLEFAEGVLLSDVPLISGTSPWKGKLGTKVAADALTWRSSPDNEQLIARQKITGDGFIAKDHTLIENGVLKAYSLSRYGAAASGEARSGNTASMYLVDPGTVSFEQMIKNIRRGILVNRFSGGSPAPNGDFSGVAKNAFLIEDGKVTRAISETMIAGNLIDLLNKIEALSDTCHGDGARLVPWAHVKGISVTG